MCVCVCVFVCVVMLLPVHEQKRTHPNHTPPSSFISPLPWPASAGKMALLYRSRRAVTDGYDDVVPSRRAANAPLASIACAIGGCDQEQGAKQQQQQQQQQFTTPQGEEEEEEEEEE